MNLSENIELINGEIADYHFRSDGGVLVSYSKSVRRTIKNISENITLAKKITNHELVLLADIFV